MFVKVRFLGIYKQYYIEDFYKFYYELMLQFLVCFFILEWKRFEIFDLNCVVIIDLDEDDEEDFMVVFQVIIYLK